MTTLYLDTFSGISGDMCLGLLVDLGLDPVALEAGLRTLPVGLALLSQQTEHSVDWGLLMAGSTVASLPVLAVFAAFQRQILSGVLAGAEK